MHEDSLFLCWANARFDKTLRYLALAAVIQLKITGSSSQTADLKLEQEGHFYTNPPDSRVPLVFVWTM